MESFIQQMQSNIYYISSFVCVIFLVFRHRDFKVYKKGFEASQLIKKEAIFLLKINIFMSVLFGVAISLNVAFGSGDQSWWLMPLIMSPISFLSTVTPVMVLFGAFSVLIAYKKKIIT